MLSAHVSAAFPIADETVSLQ